MENGATPKQTPSRRSCLICAAAKVKCISSESGSGSGAGDCDRCRRLGKECVMQAVVPRKPRTRKKTTRVAQLEQKLDGLVQLLTSKDSEQGSYPSPESSGGRGAAPSPQSAGHGDQFDGGVSRRRSAMPSFLSVSDEYGQECLEMFRQKLMPNFPFVVIPSDHSAAELRNKRPALYGAIIVASSFSSIKTQTAYGEELLRYLTEELLMKGEKSLELLQALLVYTAWYHNVLHFKRRITHLTSMMSALITDLGLARASPVNERLTLTFEETRGSYGCISNGVRTLEERRAYLGAFFISSSISANFRDLNALRRSAYLEDCCKTLERAAEYPTDRFLVCLLRLQNHVERVAHTFQYGSLELHSRHNWRVPLTLYIVPLQKDLETFRNNMPSDLQENSVLMLHYWSAMAYLFEFALYEPIQKSYFGQPCFRRMEYLYACLQTIKTFYTVLFSISTSDYYYFPLFNWTQVTHSMMTLSKLCFLHAEDWNVAQAREESNFAQLLDQISSKLDEARAIQDREPASGNESTANRSAHLERVNEHLSSLPTFPSPMANVNGTLVEMENQQDIFSTMAARLRMIRGKYEKKAAADLAAVEVQEPTTFPIGPNQLLDGTTVDMMCQLEDEAFWQELMGGAWPIPLPPEGENRYM